MPRVEVAREVAQSQHQEGEDGQSDAARDRDPNEHVDVPQPLGGTIRQVLCGVNPQSAAAAALPLSQSDSPRTSAAIDLQTRCRHSALQGRSYFRISL